MNTKILNVTWRQYLSYCERLTHGTDLAFNMLCFTIPFYKAYTKGVPHRALMDMIEHQNKLDWRTPEQRLETINQFINSWV